MEFSFLYFSLLYLMIEQVFLHQVLMHLVGLDEQLLRFFEQVIEDLLEVHLQEFLLIFLQNVQSCLEYGFPPRREEVVPELEELLIDDIRVLVLEGIGEDRDEPWRGVVASIDGFIFEVAVELGELEAEEPIELIEEEFELCELRVQQFSHLILLND